MLTDASEANPSETDLLMRLAIHHFEMDKYTDAHQWADKVIAADAQHLEGWNLRAQIRLKQNDPKRALEYHGMISELSKSMPLDQAFRAECLMMLGQKEVAIDALKQGIEEVKDWPDRLKIYKQMLEKIQIVAPSKNKTKSVKTSAQRSVLVRQRQEIQEVPRVKIKWFLNSFVWKLNPL